MNSKLLIWDMDGTLIYGGESGRVAMEKAFEIAFGVKDAFKTIEMSGRTDTIIFYDACDSLGINHNEYDKFIDTYYNVLNQDLEKLNTIKIIPNVSSVLDSLKGNGVLNILGTGAAERIARTKLSYVGLNKYFKTGGFGDNIVDRSELIKKAIENAEKLYNTSFNKEYIFIIGDTPGDIEAARALGIKIISMATGSYLVKDLMKYKPDFVFDNFEDIDHFLKVVGISLLFS